MSARAMATEKAQCTFSRARTFPSPRENWSRSSRRPGRANRRFHICGLLERPRDGEVSILGQSTASLSDRQRTLMRRHAIGYVYQFHHLLPEFTAVENIAMPRLIAGKSMREAMSGAGRCSTSWGSPIAPSTGRPSCPAANSSVAIARAAANTPSLILADGPPAISIPRRATRFSGPLATDPRTGRRLHHRHPQP